VEPRVIPTAAVQPAPLAASPKEPCTQSLSVDVRSHANLSRADEAAIDVLIGARPEVGVFLSPAWLAASFAEPAPGTEPVLVLIRSAGTVCGIVAIESRRTRSNVRIGLLGGGTGSDRIDLLAPRGLESAVADVFVRWLLDTYARQSLVIELRDLPSDSPLVGALQRASLNRSLVLQPTEVSVLPYLDLTSERAAGLSSPDARALLKHRRWLERRGHTRVDLADSPSDGLDAFEWLRHFLHLRWRDMPTGSALDDPKTARFHRRAIPLLLAERRLRMLRLVVDGRTVGVFYGVAAGRWWGYYLAGYDRRWAGRLHLGRLLLAAAIDAAAAEGAGEFDFLKGTEPVKYLWPVRERTTMDVDVYTGGPGAQLRRAARASRHAAAAAVKAVRGAF
jgi:CelD/BcsL family acetyltransferase involved in cellulose biosynthesis